MRTRWGVSVRNKLFDTNERIACLHERPLEEGTDEEEEEEREEEEEEEGSREEVDVIARGEVDEGATPFL